MEEPLRLPAVAGAEPHRASPTLTDDAGSDAAERGSQQGSTGSVARQQQQGPVVLWIEDHPQPDTDLEELHTRLARVGIELAEFDGDHAALSWAERHLPRVCCAVICASASVPVGQWRKAANRCVELAVPLLLAPVLPPVLGAESGLELDVESKPEPEPEPEEALVEDAAMTGLVLVRELPTLQVAIFERVAEKFEFVGGALRPKTAITTAEVGTPSATVEQNATPLLSAVYVQQPSWRKPPVLPQAHIKRLGGQTAVSSVATAARRDIEQQSESIADILASVPDPYPPHSPRTSRASQAASRRRLWPATKAEQAREKPPLRLGRCPQLNGQAELDVKFTVVHGPVVLSNGMPWANRLGFKNPAVLENFRLAEGETVIVTGVTSTTGKLVEGKPAKVVRYDKHANRYELDVEGQVKLQELVKRGNLRRPTPKIEPVQRNNVVLVTRRDRQNVVDEDIQRGHRYYILVYPAETGGQKSQFDEKDNAIVLDDCAVELNTDPSDRSYGVLSLRFPSGSKQTSSKLMVNGVEIRLSSLLDDDAAAIKQMQLWRDRIWHGVLNNRELDTTTNGHVVSTSHFAIVSAPEEEDILWGVLAKATPKEIGQAFNGTERVSLCCPRMHRQNLAVRKELARGLISETDVTNTLRKMTEQVREILLCEHSTLYIVDNVNAQLVAKIPDLASVSAKGFCPLKKIRVPMRDGILGEAVRTAEPVFVQDPRKDRRFDWNSFEQETGVRANSLLCVPIISGDGEVLAVVQLVNKQVGVFRSNDVDILSPDSRFGKEACFVIEHARNVKESLSARNYASEGGDWWGRWMKEVQQAAAAGQKLIVYSRRNWERRKEPEDVNVSAELNDHWPGHEIVLKAGDPIQQFTVLQQREIEWLQSEGFRLEFRRIETVDAVRSDLGGGKVYNGEWSLDGKITGKGKMEVFDGTANKSLTAGLVNNRSYYEGDFLNGQKHGTGKIKFINGDTYEGEWKSDHMHGQGVLDRGGDKYIGSFFEGKRSGQGVQEYTNTGARSHGVKGKESAGSLAPTLSSVLQGVKQQPEPPRGKMSMLARLRKSAQGLLPLRYEGGWKNDLHHGQGKLTRVNGQWERCMFAKGEVVEMLDSGTALQDGRHEDIEYPNGDKYSGSFKDGKMHGPKGKMTYKDGRVFIGDFKDGKRHGFGKMKFPDGRKFNGPWKEDKIHGPDGVMSYPDGRTYRGEWKDNKKHGTGEHTYVDKDSDEKKVSAVYIGEFQANSRHGNGRFEYRSSEVNRWEESEYVHGKQVRIVRFGLDIPDGVRKYKWPSFVAGHVHQCIPNGDTYEGEWIGGQMCGKGRMQYANGDIFEGTWYNNLPNGTGLTVFAAAKRSWVVSRWANGEERKVIKKGTKADKTPNIDELCWLQKMHEATLKIIHGPEIFAGECLSSTQEAERYCVVIACQPGGQDGIMDEGEKDEIGEWDERHTIFYHTGPDSSDFERQAIPLELCTFELNQKRGDPNVGEMRIVTREGCQHVFSSMMEDEEMAMAQMEQFQNELQAAIERNRDLDSPKFVRGARFAVAAFPTEETMLCDHLIYAKPEQLAKAFEGEEKVSICVCWTKEGLYKDAWWDRWTSAVREAYSDGQTIVCFDRRQWSERTEPRDVFIPPDHNVDWPGKAVELAKGNPIYRHDSASQRQVAWLRKQCDDPHRKRAKQNWDPKRFEFWRVDKTLDVLRSEPDCHGNMYTGEWNVKGLKHGQGKQVWSNGDTYEGEWKHGKQHGQGVMKFRMGGRYEGKWKAGTKHGNGKFFFSTGDTYDGEWRRDQEHGRGKYTHNKLQRWELSTWSEGKPGAIIASGKVGEVENRLDGPTDAIQTGDISEEGEDEDDRVESTSLRLEKKLRAMQTKMERDEAIEKPLTDRAEVKPVVADHPSAVHASTTFHTEATVQEGDQTNDATGVVEDAMQTRSIGETYSTDELIEILDEMDALELHQACIHHGLSVQTSEHGSTSAADMREALKAHYLGSQVAIPPAEVPEEDIRAPSPVIGGGADDSGELQTFKSQSTAKVAGFRSWANSRGMEEARLL